MAADAKTSNGKNPAPARGGLTLTCTGKSIPIPDGVIIVQKIAGVPEGVRAGIGKVTLGHIYSVPLDKAVTLTALPDFAVFQASDVEKVEARRKQLEHKTRDAG